MSRRAVCLDGASLQNMNWDPLESIVDLTVHDRTPADTILPRSRGASILLVDKVELDEAILRRLPVLEYIGVMATGVDNVARTAARDLGITVTNVPDYATDSVAQHTIAILLELTNRVNRHHRAVKDGSWSASPDFCLLVEPITELSGKTLGIVGMGTIGQTVARIGRALGMTITAAHQPSMDEISLPGISIEWRSHGELFDGSDVVSLHCPLNDQTRGMVDGNRLATMKDDVLLLNTARGGLVEVSALVTALKQGTIGGYGADVLEQEPPPENHPLIGAPNCVLTPHVAWASQEAKQRRLQQTADNLQAYLEGDPINVVN